MNKNKPIETESPFDSQDEEVRRQAYRKMYEESANKAKVFKDTFEYITGQYLDMAYMNCGGDIDRVEHMIYDAAKRAFEKAYGKKARFFEEIPASIKRKLGDY